MLSPQWVNRHDAAVVSVRYGSLLSGARTCRLAVEPPQAAVGERVVEVVLPHQVDDLAVAAEVDLRASQRLLADADVDGGRPPAARRGVDTLEDVALIVGAAEAIAAEAASDGGAEAALAIRKRGQVLLVDLLRGDVAEVVDVARKRNPCGSAWLVLPNSL